MDDDAKSIAEKIIQLVGVLGQIPTTDFTRRLHYKASRSQRAAEFELNETLDLGSIWPGDDPDPDAGGLGEFSVPQEISRLADVSVVRALRDNDNQFKMLVDFAASEEVFEEKMTHLTYLCYLEHMDMTLKERPIQISDERVKSFRRLRLACTDNRIPIADFLKRALIRPSFVQKTIQDDIVQGNHLRSMTLLFIMDFLSRDAYNGWPWDTSGNFVFKPSIETLAQWSRTLWDIRGKGNKAQTQKILIFCGRAATAVHHANGASAPSSTYDVTVALYNHILDQLDQDHQYKNELREALQGLVQDDVNAWTCFYQDFKNTWWAAQFPLWNDAVKKELGIDNGSQIAEWIHDGYLFEDNLDLPHATILKRPQVGNGAYLLASTHVTLADGTTRQADQLEPGDKLLTLAKPQENAELSEKLYPVEMTAPLVGFNGEEPFATTAQVFHTSTGLRAVHPTAAMRQNPWLRVGRLAVGHILYRHQSPAQDYEKVEVKSIQETAPTKRTVYRLQLSEGKRLHHQNGYLVNVNEPEIRVQDVATLLGQFSTKDQVALLSSVKEIRSMLLAHGQQTVWERLQMELAEYGKASKDSPWDIPLFARHTSIHPHKRLSHLTQRFQLEPMHSDQQLPIEKLPLVTLVDGVPLLDGEAHPRVAIDDTDRVVSWTREIQGKKLFEHGRLEVYPTEDGGTGTLFYSSESDPRSFKDGQIVQAKAALASVLTLPLEDGLYASMASGTYGLSSKWILTLDEAAWPKGDKREQPKIPKPFDSIITGIESIPEGVNVNFFKVPLLDKLLAAINKNQESKGLPLIEDDLYEGYMESVLVKEDCGSPIRVSRTYINLTQPSLILSHSDQAPDSTNIFDLTFKESLGIDLQLPALFHSFYLDTSTFAETVTGALYELDPEKREAKGERHLVVGKYDDDDDDDDFEESVQRDRAFVSQAFASHVTPGVSQEHDPQLQPAVMTVLLKTQTEVTIEGLINMQYNPDDVHSLAQTTITEMMYYHMDQKQLDDFTIRGRPTQLPSQLTTQLDPNLREWLKNTYAPAFIAQNISQIEKYSDRFKDNEREKVWYWWAGNGDKCLAHTKEYTQINAITSSYAMKTKYSCLDVTPSKGEELAKGLYDAITTKPKMKDILSRQDVRNSPIELRFGLTRRCLFLQNWDTINKLCIIMHTLNPDNKYAQDWFQLIVKYAAKKHLHVPFLKGDDGNYVGEWLDDAMHDLILKVLSNDQSIAKDVRDQLQKDLDKFMDLTNTANKSTADKKAAAIRVYTQVIGAELGKLIAMIGNQLPRISRVKKTFGLAKDLVEKVCGKWSGAVQGLARAVAPLAVVAYFVNETCSLVGIIKDWKELTPAQRTTSIAEFVRVVVSAVDQGFEMWQEYKDSKTPKAAQAVSETILDEKLAMTITGPEGNGLTNLADELHAEEGGLEGVISEKLARSQSISSGNILSETEVWNSDRDSTPSNLAPNEEETASKLSTTAKWLRGVSILLGAIVSASMTITLVQEWDQLTNAGKWINTIAVVVQILSVVIEVGDLLLTTGIIASATLSVALPCIGVVLAVAGIALMIVTTIMDIYKTDPQPDPVGDFVQKTARPVIKSWNDPPPSKLTYNLNKSEVSSSGTTTVTVTGKSRDKDASLAYTKITVWTGQSDDCLFAEEAFYLSDDPDKKTGGTVTLTPSDLAKPTLKQTLLGTRPSRYAAYDLWASGAQSADNKTGSLVVAKGKEFQCSFLGKINKAGKSIIEIVESTIDGTKTHSVLDIKRL
ncbi:uncharacterized protein N7459_002925 [Penicillium hispanicum]|uniref:uncharacterized protein n=1 Tax=Penicillium hispanicum TaxID=1080232 RepID=UPI002541F4E5|nr:uncharacterized protein N7459_002925 [Penicillium hispanicum]KAJ5587160.1 hypothetical protein N7459_002925 [Penicillium hispanicum]